MPAGQRVDWQAVHIFWLSKDLSYTVYTPEAYEPLLYPDRQEVKKWALVILLCLLIATIGYIWKYRKETALWKKILMTFSAFIIFLITAVNLSPAAETTQK